MCPIIFQNTKEILEDLSNEFSLSSSQKTQETNLVRKCIKDLSNELD